ncbi:MAG: hypothetical protein ABI580_08960, partial [Burkholderiaceae bacterium]
MVSSTEHPEHRGSVTPVSASLPADPGRYRRTGYTRGHAIGYAYPELGLAGFEDVPYYAFFAPAG